MIYQNFQFYTFWFFCDDTTIIASGKNISDLVNFVNSELRKNFIWFRVNMMSLHPCKKKFTIFHSYEQSIPWDELYIVIDDNDEDCLSPDPSLIKKLAFLNKHSDTPAIRLNVKLSKALFNLRRAKNILSEQSLKQLSLSFNLLYTY